MRGIFQGILSFLSNCHFDNMRFFSENKELSLSLSCREAGMRQRRSTICCSSVLLSAAYASSASAWSIAGLLWTVVEPCSSAGCFHTPSIIRFSTTDPLCCTKTMFSRWEWKLTAPKMHLLSAFIDFLLSIFAPQTFSWISGWTVPSVRIISDEETSWGEWQERMCSKILGPQIRAGHSVVVLGRMPDPCHVHALHPV